MIFYGVVLIFVIYLMMTMFRRPVVKTKIVPIVYEEPVTEIIYPWYGGYNWWPSWTYGGGYGWNWGTRPWRSGGGYYGGHRGGVRDGVRSYGGYGGRIGGGGYGGRIGGRGGGGRR